MKKDIEEFVVMCTNGQQEKEEYQKPGDLLQDPSSYLEVGRHQYGFCSGFSSDSKVI